MKKKEKYAKEIIEIACDGDSLAVNKATGKLTRCGNIRCKKCICYEENVGCNGKYLRQWAESEYIEKQVISKKDKAFLDYLDKRFKYITRDNKTLLDVYSMKPSKGLDSWVRNSGDFFCFYDRIDVDFPMIKWEDDEPWLIENLKKLEVVDSYE